MNYGNRHTCRESKAFVISGIGCDLPSVPHGFIGPVLFNASFFPTFVPFDQSVAFVCPPHQRFSDDFDISRLDVFCRDDGIDGRMEMPSNLPWCVEREYFL